MSQENVEIVMGGFAAWNAGDMEAARKAWHPDATIMPPRRWPEPEIQRGRDAVFRQFERLRGAWDTDSLQVTDVRDANDLVVVRFTWHGTGHGPEIALEMTAVYSLRDGLIVAQDNYWDHAEALEAAGLSE